MIFCLQLNYFCFSTLYNKNNTQKIHREKDGGEKGRDKDGGGMIRERNYRGKRILGKVKGRKRIEGKGRY